MPTYNPRTVVIQNTTEVTEQPIENITNEYVTNTYYQLNYHFPAGMVAFFPFFGLAQGWTQESTEIFKDPNGAYWLIIWAAIPTLSIGNVNSSAAYKSAKLIELFKAFWNFFPVAGGKGADWQSDWTANKIIQFDNYQGKFFRCFDSLAPAAQRINPGYKSGSNQITIPPHDHSPKGLLQRAFDANAAANVVANGVNFNATQNISYMPEHIAMLPMISLGIVDVPSNQISPPTDPPTSPPTDPPTSPPTDPPVSPPVDPPVDPPVSPPVDPPATNPAFDLGINLGGNNVTINGNYWTSFAEAQASGLTIPTGFNQATTNVTPNPAVDTATRTMLNGVIWKYGNLTLQQTISNGSLEIYVWIMENSSAGRSFTLTLQGAVAATGIGNLAVGGWQRYGPYPVNVSNGVLSIQLTGNTDCHLMGVEVWRI